MTDAQKAPDLSTGYRTHSCGDLRASDVGEKVKLAGWVQNRRDHGGLLFIDLRDRYGPTQVVFHPEGKETFAAAEKLGAEFVIHVEGEVAERPAGNANPKLTTGEIEVHAAKLEVLSTAETPPFEIQDWIDAGEEVRLRYRYLDLRRPVMQKALLARHRGVLAVREFLSGEGFVEVETPLLAKSTPEGARDFLVPSRLYPGKFYALPQSPQLFKQLLMVAGFDRYFQVARCLRDEDPRADRVAEHTQFDIEMSFASQEDVFRLGEGVMRALFKGGAEIDLATPFERMTYAECVRRFGCDKPDLRFGLELADVSEIVKDSDFKVFRGAVEAGGVVRALAAPGCASWSRKEIESLVPVAEPFGAKGVAWVKFEAGEFAGGIAKFFAKDVLASIAKATGAESGALIVFVADKPKVVDASLAALRNHLGAKLELAEDGFRFLWVTDFPLFNYSETEKRWTSEHHPFTAPAREDLDLIESDPGRVRSQSYDLVVNGMEVASGSVRIHEERLQKRIFEALKLAPEQIEERFGFFTRALSYGTPPHAGLAPGVDRLCAIMLGLESIREVIAFPKTQRAQDLMTGAPGEVDAKQLRELGIRPGD